MSHKISFGIKNVARLRSKFNHRKSQDIVTVAVFFHSSSMISVQLMASFFTSNSEIFVLEWNYSNIKVHYRCMLCSCLPLELMYIKQLLFLTLKFEPFVKRQSLPVLWYHRYISVPSLYFSSRWNIKINKTFVILYT